MRPTAPGGYQPLVSTAIRLRPQGLQRRHLAFPSALKNSPPSFRVVGVRTPMVCHLAKSPEGYRLYIRPAVAATGPPIPHSSLLPTYLTSLSQRLTSCAQMQPSPVEFCSAYPRGTYAVPRGNVPRLSGGKCCQNLPYPRTASDFGSSCHYRATTGTAWSKACAFHTLVFPSDSLLADMSLPSPFELFSNAPSRVLHDPGHYASPTTAHAYGLPRSFFSGFSNELIRCGTRQPLSSR